MVAAERTFAARGLADGIRDAFVAFLSEDAVGFYPTPQPARRFYASRPPSPMSRRLEWAPRVGDVSTSGDLGWLAGPFTLTDTTGAQPPQHGCYFSIWRDEADRGWRVLMDVGIDTPTPPPFAPGLTRMTHDRGLPQSARSPASVQDAERQLADTLTIRGTAAYDTVLADDARLHVPGRLPLEGRPAIREWLAESPARIALSPQDGNASRDNDLGYVWGRYTRSTPSTSPEAGYYVHVWVRHEGQWRLAVEVRSPAPEAP